MCLSAGEDVSECELYSPNKRKSIILCDTFNEHIMYGLGMIF